MPPYLLDRYDPARGDGVDVSLDVELSVITLAVHGMWGDQLQREVHTALYKSLSEHPAALILDLQAVTDPQAASVATWATVERAGEMMDPPVRVVACVPEVTALADRLHRVGATRYLPVFSTVARARAAAAEWLPWTGRLKVQLAPDDRAAPAARAVLCDACTAWRMPDLRDRGRLVVSELVANAVEHAGTPITVLLSRRGTGLHLAVRDDHPHLPRLVNPSVRIDELPQRRGLGLHTVQAAATMWGAIPAGHGKVVWATIRSWRRRR